MDWSSARNFLVTRFYKQISAINLLIEFDELSLINKPTLLNLMRNAIVAVLILHCEVLVAKSDSSLIEIKTPPIHADKPALDLQSSHRLSDENYSIGILALNTTEAPGQVLLPQPTGLSITREGDISQPSNLGNRLWNPAPGATWQWQLTNKIDTSIDVQMYDIDLFNSSQSTIDQLHAKNRIVICYFSAGSWENWRSDAKSFPKSVLGKGNGWAGEKWLDIRKLDILGPIMGARLEMAVKKGCDGVEPDNVDGYTNSTGFPLTYRDQLKFNKWLASEAHKRGLSIGLKNALDLVKDLVGDFDWALNEQCFEYNECELLLPFVRAEKAVFGVEYKGEPKTFCSKANKMRFSWLKKKLDLDSWRIDCRDF